MSEIKITLVEDYGECGHMDNGCSGWESVEIIATDGKRTESAKQESCFGVSAVECFQEVMNKWQARTTQQQPVGEDEAVRIIKEQYKQACTGYSAKELDCFAAHAYRALLAINAIPAQETPVDRRKHERRIRPSLQTNAGNRREKERRK